MAKSSSEEGPGTGGDGSGGSPVTGMARAFFLARRRLPVGNDAEDAAREDDDNQSDDEAEQAIHSDAPDAKGSSDRRLCLGKDLTPDFVALF